MKAIPLRRSRRARSKAVPLVVTAPRRRRHVDVGPVPPIHDGDDESIDAAALDRSLDEAVADQQGSDAQRRIIALIKTALTEAAQRIERRFLADQDGAHVLTTQTMVIDTLVKSLHRIATTRLFRVANPTKGEQIAVLAVGGYGRGELAPHSDIDLLFLLPYKPTPFTEQVVEYLYYALWDLGLKVGHSTRSIDDCIRQAKADLTIRTSLVEVRFLVGAAKLFHDLQDRFEKDVIQGSAVAFVDAKLAERDERHRRLGDSRYVLEPNIKEGKGGLRDLHGLLWIAKYLFRVETLAELVKRRILTATEAQRFDRDQRFLWTVRCHLHYLTGRPEERLTFEVQSEIGRRMGYTDHTGTRGVERFMKHYFLIAKDVGDLTRVFIAVLEEGQKKKPLPLWRRLLPGGSGVKSLEGFIVDAGRLSVAEENTFTAEPLNLIRLFHVAQAQGLDIHPNALRFVTLSRHMVDAKLRNDPEANRLFLEILTSHTNPEIALRRMSEAGVLGRFVPDFGRVIAQMQYDMYHVYTVDEHTLYAVGILHGVEVGKFKEELPLATSLFPALGSRRALYVAIFLHDIAKGRGGDHSEIGGRIARKLGPRFGLTVEETDTASWLIENHLLMSRTAFKRDIEDPKTVENFAKTVQSPERLKLLLTLTAVDIRAVGPTVWNGWKAALLRRLYQNAQELISGAPIEDARGVRILRAQAAVRTLLSDFSDGEFDAFIQRGYAFYWLSNNPETLARHARIMRGAEVSKASITVDSRIDHGRAVTEVVVYAADHAGLFSRLAGAVALAGARIVDARIVTMSNGMALDSFWIQDADGAAFERPGKLEQLAALFEGVLEGRVKPHVELTRPPPYPSRTRVFTVAPRVIIDNKASAEHTVIEVNGRDRSALLFDLTQALTSLGLQISAAKISTYGERVVDVFFVKDVFGLKIEAESKLQRMRERLIRVLREAEPQKARDSRAKISA